MPKVSVVILNWNGKRYLHKCITSLSKVAYKPLEVILVDNNSTDGSTEYIKKNFPWVKVVQNSENVGFAQGNNIGCKNATGDYVLFLNNDTVVTPDFLRVLINSMQKDSRIGCIQPQMRIMDNTTLQDEAGGYLTHGGFLYHYGYKKSHKLKIYHQRREAFSLKGACILIPRKVFLEVGEFDADFFIFFEETDLCYRLWLAGYKVVYDPSVYIYHTVGGDTKDRYSYERRIYLTFKNMTCSYLKNFGTRNFLCIYPGFLGIQILLCLYYLITFQWLLLRAIIKAYAWNISHLRSTLIKRSIVQNHIRKLTDRDVNKHILHNPSLRYLVCSLTSTQHYVDSPIEILY